MLIGARCHQREGGTSRRPAAKKAGKREPILRRMVRLTRAVSVTTSRSRAARLACWRATSWGEVGVAVSDESGSLS